VLYNKAKADGKYDVVLKTIRNDSTQVINSDKENAVVPIWSVDGKKIAYLAFESEIENSFNIDLYSCKLILYDLESQEKRVLAADAGFTDKAFPQMCFDEKDEFIYFTKINENGLGSIAKVNLKTFQQEVISKDPTLDERFPHVKSF
jgi:Tol biopolymer transport system component